LAALIRPLRRRLPGHDVRAMADRPAHPPLAHPLTLLPGSRLVLFLVRVDDRPAALPVPPAAFLDGLRAADALLSFSGLHREDTPLDELLPWAGSV